jgi:hypothetical protein
MWEDGVVNNYGTQIWNWDDTATASGLAIQDWHGVLYNGTANVQYGSNFEACLVKWSGCYGHGMRRWITATGPGGFSSW